jgi:hypothetical protein
MELETATGAVQSVTSTVMTKQLRRQVGSAARWS